MCGRYTLSSPGDMVAEVFGLPYTPELPLRYNIAPTQESAVVRVPAHGAPRRLDMLRWGLVPFWAEDAKIGNRMINARSEGIENRPAFGESFRRRRCLVPADGFYEWMPTGDRRAKQPYHLRRADRRPFAFAGLWSRWRPPAGPPLETYTILTTDAAPGIRAIHDRMPVILEPDRFDLWLDPAVEDPERLKPLLAPHLPESFEAVAVSTRVNKPEHDEPDCLEPLVEAGGQLTL